MCTDAEGVLLQKACNMHLARKVEQVPHKCGIQGVEVDLFTLFCLSNLLRKRKNLILCTLILIFRLLSIKLEWIKIKMLRKSKFGEASYIF